MASKIEFQSEFEVGIEALWNAITKDKYDVLRKAAPQLMNDAMVLEGNGGLGTLASISFGDAATHVPPVKEKIVEFHETNHVVSSQGIEGDFLMLELVYYNISFKLDDLRNGKILAKMTIKYELDNETNDKQMGKKFNNLISEYIKIVSRYLEKNNA